MSVISPIALQRIVFSLNSGYFTLKSSKKLDDTYKLAWIRGLKTTYYLRTVGATHAEKSTGRAGQMNSVSSSAAAPQAITSASSSLMAAALASQAELAPSPATDIKFCAIDDPGCEACQ